MILCIESATYKSSVALVLEDEILAETTIEDKGESHSGALPVAVSSLLELHSAYRPCAVAISQGPGSYTGLRIGTSLAKGLCMGFDVPLLGINTLAIMAHGMHELQPNADFYIPAIDARRMEVYSQVYDTNLRPLEDIRAEIVNDKSYASWMQGQVVMAGNGAEKCRGLYPSASFLDDEVLHARHMQKTAWRKWDSGEIEDVTAFEPFYLKEYQPGKPSQKIKNILGL